MRNRAGFGAKRLAVVLGALAALALAPATASAVTSSYHQNLSDRTFANDDDVHWAQSESYASCVQGLTCPETTNSIPATGGVDDSGDGFLRTAFGGLSGLLGGTSTGTWTSPAFAYGGAGGAQPTSLNFSLASQANIGGVLGSGTSLTYAATLEHVGGGSRSLVPPTSISSTAAWSGIPPVTIPPNALELGQEYKFRVATSYSAGADVLPNARVDYDNVALVAEAPGSGPAGGGVAGGGLASKTVVMKGDKLRVKVRCGRAVQGRCKIKMVGLWKKQGPRVTKLRKVFVRHGKTKKVNLKLRPRAIAAVATRDDIWIAIKVNANGFKTLKIKKLNVRVQN
jgi:hypothetical protein